MTVVLGQQFIKGIILIADSRASVQKNGQYIPWRDNTQKLFRLGDELFIGLAGDIEIAGMIIGFLGRQIQNKPRLSQLHVFSEKGPKLIRYAYDQACRLLKRNAPVQFIVAGVDHSRGAPVVDKDGKLIPNLRLGIFDKKVFSLSSPGFTPTHTSMNDSVIAIGSGVTAFEATRSEFEKMKFNKFTFSVPLAATAVLYGDILAKKIREMNIDSVGGMIQIVTVDDSGAGFIPYQSRSYTNTNPGSKLDLEIGAREDGRLYQKNLTTGKEVDLLFPPEVISIQDPNQELFET